MPPIVLFGLQFTFSLVAYGVFAAWYAVPRLAPWPQAQALAPLLWVHVFRIAGGAILAPGSVDPSIPADFRAMVGLGDMATALLALVALVALRTRAGFALGLVWLFLVFATADTANAVVQSLRYDVFDAPLGLNWTIVTCYVPALLVSSWLILVRLLRPAAAA